MEEELLLQQPADRRLGANVVLSPGPPGVELDRGFYRKMKADSKGKSMTPVKFSRRRSPSGSPPPSRRKTPLTRGRRTPISPKRRRSPSRSPRRNRFRDYSPDRRRYDRSRFQQDRRRLSPRDRERDRDRDRDRDRIGRRVSPRRSGGWNSSNVGGSGRRTPIASPSLKKKPASPPPPPNLSEHQQPIKSIDQRQAPLQYNVPPPQLYSGDSYSTNNSFNHQFVVQPIAQTTFNPTTDAYGVSTSTNITNFNASYPPPPIWTSENYPPPQQQWIQQHVPSEPSTTIHHMSNANINVNVTPAQISPHTKIQQSVSTVEVVATPAPVAPPQQTHIATDRKPTSTTTKPIATASTKITSNAEATATAPAPAPATTSAAAAAAATAAAAADMPCQPEDLKKQRNSYIKKSAVLRIELEMLKKQHKDLVIKDGSVSPSSQKFIDENEKLQTHLNKKINTFENVIAMLTGLIGDESPGVSASIEPIKAVLNQVKQQQQKSKAKTKKKRVTQPVSPKSSSNSSSDSSSSSSSSTTSSSTSENEDDDESPQCLKNKAMATMTLNKQKDSIKKAKDMKVIEDNKQRFNYVFYDPEMHWCQTCSVFPKSAKDYLNHLHSKEHMEKETIDTSWHLNMVNDNFPTYPNLQTKRTPIRGLTFFVPATAWFCKLCNFWMGDLHCASSHLKSQLHANLYNNFLEKNPHFEGNWLANRQKSLNEKKPNAVAQQSMENTTQQKKTKKLEEKTKKRKKKSSDKKEKKKKKKRSKKHKKETATLIPSVGGTNAFMNVTNSSSSSSESSNDSDMKTFLQTKDDEKISNLVADVENTNAGASIRVAMRKQQEDSFYKNDEHEVAPPPPIITHNEKSAASTTKSGPIGKWIVAQEGIKPITTDPTLVNTTAATTSNRTVTVSDDAVIQQWNSIQPVISESEKKLFEQLKGKLKVKSNETTLETAGKISTGSSNRNPFNATEKENRDRRRSISDTRRETISDSRRRGRSRSPYYGGRKGGRSRTRSRSRGRDGRDYRRDYRRNWIGGRRRSRSPRRSRSRDRRYYSPSRSRSRSNGRNSRGRDYIEKAVVRQPEFRPRVPEKEKDKKSNDIKDKKDNAKKPKPATPTDVSTLLTATTTVTAASGKKLPFIGKMPVFKKQPSIQPDGSTGIPNVADQLYQTDASAASQFNMHHHHPHHHHHHHPAPPHHHHMVPTAAHIQMAMMEDVYGNAPPFHPDVAMMTDYDDLMPDPVQFNHIMAQAPPPPPPEDDEDVDENILPPGIDEAESDECVPKPISDPPIPHKGPLPKEFEEALNIIFPGENKLDDNNETGATRNSSGETQIIVETPVMQVEDLVKEGIHMVTFDQTNATTTLPFLIPDEASQLSMNEPLVFNTNRISSSIPTSTSPIVTQREQGNRTIDETKNDFSGGDLSHRVLIHLKDDNNDNDNDNGIFMKKKLSNGIKNDNDENNKVAICESDKVNKNVATLRKRSESFEATNIGNENSDNGNNINDGNIDVVRSKSNDIDNNDKIDEKMDDLKDVNKIVVSENKKTMGAKMVENLELIPTPDEIPMPDDEPLVSANLPNNEQEVKIMELNLDDIPHPPPSPTNSEKNRRREQLDDLAMLGIDEDDMAAQCM